MKSVNVVLFALAGFLVTVTLVGAGVAQDQKAANGQKARLVERKAIATFAGGCFWCMEAPFDALEGVFATISGYMGGHKDKPTYREVSAGTTGHTEVVQVHYDPTKVSYQTLLEVFWHNIDPLAENRQFCDAGSQYRSAIFFHSPSQEKQAQASLKRLMASGILSGPIKTELAKADTFFIAEEYHQDFYLKEPQHYQRYRTGCGRDARLRQIWGDAAKRPK